MRSVRWLDGHAYAWIFIGFGTGVLVAFPLAAPILGSVIPEGVATLWGSALGALIAVAGAYLVVSFQIRTQRRVAASLVYGAFSGAVHDLKDLASKLGEPSSEEEPATGEEPTPLSRHSWILIEADARAFLKSRQVAIGQQRRIDAALNFLGPEELFGLFALESELEKCDKVVTDLLSDAVRAVRHPDAVPILWSHRKEISQHQTAARSYLDRFVKVFM